MTPFTELTYERHNSHHALTLQHLVYDLRFDFKTLDCVHSGCYGDSDLAWCEEFGNV